MTLSLPVCPCPSERGNYCEKQMNMKNMFHCVRVLCSCVINVMQLYFWFQAAKLEAAKKLGAHDVIEWSRDSKMGSLFVRVFESIFKFEFSYIQK